jgi:excisionase family DNA binding protein
MGNRDEHIAGALPNRKAAAEGRISDGQRHQWADVKAIALKCDIGNRQQPVAFVGLDQRDVAMLAAARARSAASELISVADLAEQLGVSVRTIRRWQAQGDAPMRVKRSRRRMYRLSDVVAWLEATGRGSDRE